MKESINKMWGWKVERKHEKHNWMIEHLRVPLEGGATEDLLSERNGNTSRIICVPVAFLQDHEACQQWESSQGSGSVEGRNKQAKDVETRGT